jgi:hypothetical protein
MHLFFSLQTLLLSGASFNMKKSWADSWSSVVPTPFSRTSARAEAAVTQRGPSVIGLLLSIQSTEKSIRFQVRIDQSVILGEKKLEAGTEITVGLWREDPSTILSVNVIDRIRLTDCYASPSKKEAGKMYYNCKSVQLEQSWLEVCADDTYLAQQSLSGKFILTSRAVKCDEKLAAAGIWSDVVWPNDVSIVKKNGSEVTLLTFRGKYMKWTADDVTKSRQPQPVIFEFKLWANHCEQLIPGPLSMDQWKCLMCNQRNAIPFSVICSIDGSRTTLGGGKSLNIHALRADVRGYLLSASCPSVSRALVKKNISPAGGAEVSSNVDGIVNVSASGLHKAGAFPIFRAMTSNPDELTSEEAIQEALTEGAAETAIVFFGLANDDKEQPSLKKHKKEETKKGK